MQSLTIEAWIELDTTNNSEKELENLSFSPGATVFSGIRNRIDVIRNSNVVQNIEYNYTTSMNNEHMHGIDSIDIDGNGYTKVHQHRTSGTNNTVSHRHKILNGVVQVAGANPHVHNLKPATSIIDKRTKNLLTSIPIAPTATDRDWETVLFVPEVLC